MKQRAFAIISSEQFWPQCKVLLASIRKFNPDYAVHLLWLGNVEKRHDWDFKFRELGVTHVYIPDDFPINPSPELSVGQRVAAYRPALIREVFETHVNGVIYLGADTCLYAPIDTFYDELVRHRIVLTPHVLTPVSDLYQIHKSGQANTDVIAFRKDSKVIDFLDWLEYLITKPAPEEQHDQVWMNFAPSFIDGVGFCRDPGMNFAYWNAEERALKHSKEMERMGKPRWAVSCSATQGDMFNPSMLKLAHFSGMDFSAPRRMSIYNQGPDAEGDRLVLYEQYAKAVWEQRGL